MHSKIYTVDGVIVYDGDYTYAETPIKHIMNTRGNLNKLIFKDISFTYAYLPVLSFAESVFMNCDFFCADFSYCNFVNCKFKDCTFHHSLLRKIKFNKCYGDNVDFSGAQLVDSIWKDNSFTNIKFDNASLSGAVLPDEIESQIPNCPGGDLIGWKKLTNSICKILIPAQAARSRATSNKCRAEFAKVLKFYPDCITEDKSLYNPNFLYEINQTVRPTYRFNRNRWEECTSGIHFFLTRKEAEAYEF